jgi:putative phage-type endonuclease
MMQHHGPKYVHPKVQAILVAPQWEQRTPEWYAMRRTLITASDAAAAIGIPPYASYRGDIRADTVRKKVENKKLRNMYVAHGVKYEDEARDLAADALGVTFYDIGLLQHPTLPWLGASPDGISNTGIMLEIKCPLRRTIVPGEIPHHYVPQIQVQMEVADLDICAFVQYRPGEVLDICFAQRDRQWFETHVESLKTFWEAYMEAQKTHVPEPPPTCTVNDALYDDAWF